MQKPILQKRMNVMIEWFIIDRLTPTLEIQSSLSLSQFRVNRIQGWVYVTAQLITRRQWVNRLGH